MTDNAELPYKALQSVRSAFRAGDEVESITLRTMGVSARSL